MIPINQSPVIFMKIRSSHALFCRCLVLLAALCCAASASAQQMPQDNWRYDGLQFADPTNNVLRSIAIGSGGVYAGEVNGGSPTKVIQFTEGGVFVRRFTATFTFILGIACDPAGNVYVLDRGDSRVKIFDQNGTFIRQWGGAGTADGLFSLASANAVSMLAVDKNSQVYVCDSGNTRVQVISSTGTFVRKWGSIGSLPSQFSSGNPTWIAWSPNGELYVANNGAGNLSAYAEDGTFLRSGSPGYFSYGYTTSPDGLLVTMYHGAGYLYVLDSNFANVASYGSGFDNGVYYGVAVSKRGDIYAISSDTTHIRVYEREYSNVQNSLLPPALPQPVVLSATQRAGTSLMDIEIGRAHV